VLEPTEVQVIPSANLLIDIARLVGTGGPFNGSIVSLFQNPIAPGRLSALADFHVATFDGYADSSAITWSSAYYDSDGTALVLGTDQLFVATGGVTPNTIYGYILATAARAALLAAFAFSAPVGVGRAGDAVPVVPFFRYSGN
jgi:hypothetical protein